MKLTYLKALNRGFAVWLKGMGAGIGIVAVITTIMAYNKLKFVCH